MKALAVMMAILFVPFAFLAYQDRQMEIENAAHRAESERQRAEWVNERIERRQLEIESCSPNETETYRQWYSRIQREKKPICTLYSFNGWKSMFSRNDMKESSTKKGQLGIESCFPSETETYRQWYSRIQREKKPICILYSFNDWKSMFNRNDMKENSTKKEPPCRHWDENLCLEGGDVRWEKGRLVGTLRNKSGKTLSMIYVEYRCLDRNGVVVDRDNDRMWSEIRPNEAWKFKIKCWEDDAYTYQLTEVSSR